MRISIFFEKKDNYKAIKELTYFIGNTGSELQNKNREDIDIAAFSYNDAKYIRKEIQVNNEELYNIYIYLIVFEKNKEDLKTLLNKVENILESSGLIPRRAYFREEQLFKACMPIMENSIDIKNAARRNILTNGIVATYPFISSTIFDKDGIFIGSNMDNESLIFINKFDNKKYKNANMCVFGTSGAGKSYFIKLQVLRNRLSDINQYIIDPEREYIKIVKHLNGINIKLGPNSNTFINIFDIREESLEDGEGYLINKISKLIGFFSLIFENIDEEEKGLLEEKIIECYKRKGINFNDKSLYKIVNNKKRFKESKDMPILNDFYNLLTKDEKLKKLSNKLIPFIEGSMKFLNNYTNVELNNKLIVGDIYELGEDNIKYGMYIFIEIFWDKIKKDRKSKKIIYMDEIWRLIGVTSNKHVASFIYKMFKTIRKYGGSTVAITQDISDIFSLEKGIYGKSILNNSNIKVYFNLEEENILTLSKFANLSDKEKLEIKSLKRGECLMIVNDNHILSKIEAAEFEKEILNE